MNSLNVAKVICTMAVTAQRKFRLFQGLPPVEWRANSEGSDIYASRLLRFSPRRGR
jgi:hypothetical protein